MEHFRAVWSVWGEVLLYVLNLFYQGFSYDLLHSSETCPSTLLPHLTKLRSAVFVSRLRCLLFFTSEA